MTPWTAYDTIVADHRRALVAAAPARKRRASEGARPDGGHRAAHALPAYLGSVVRRPAVFCG